MPKFLAKHLSTLAVMAAASAVLLLGLPGPAQAETARANNQIIEEVTVTARKREERVMDTPVAVSVMGEQELERYNTT